ncbi:MAG: hypothetical protein HYS08_02130 [Chlamydiae bacterium]|nr:hypothetical protein [Chlamydiota bacterium]MBI3266673.1 hypothetical protein [Chlamydiota bacterium]
MIKHNSFGEGSLRRILGGVILTVGWILSPLTWWNDWLVNLPLSWLLANFSTSPQNRHVFGMWFVFFYWLSNLLGFLLMYVGWRFFSLQKRVTKKEVVTSFFVSAGVTIVILFLIRIGWIKPIL